MKSHVRQKRVLIVSGTPIAPATAGNRARLRTLISGLQSRGAEIYLLLCGPDPGDLVETRRLVGERCLYIHHRFPVPAYPWWLKLLDRVTAHRMVYGNFRFLRDVDDVYCRNLDDSLRHVARTFNPDMVISAYVFMSAALRGFDDSVLKVIDTHDVLANRLWRFWRTGTPINAWTMSTKQENRGLDRAHVVLAIQDMEAREFRSRTRADVIKLGHPVALNRLPLKSPGANKRLLFVGSDNHLNKRGIDAFIHRCLPEVRALHRDAHLEIVGSICDFVEPGEGIILTGVLDDLTHAYARADVVINPVEVATGLAIKNLEPLAFARPLVVLGRAGRGLHEDEGRAFLLARSHRDMVRKILSVLDDQSVAELLSANAYEFAQRLNADCNRAIDELMEAADVRKGSECAELARAS